MAKKTKKWEMNETQKAFIQALRKNGGSATLFELNHLQGYTFKSGAINHLIKAEVVNTDTEKAFTCDIVYNGVVVGKQTKKAKVYTLNE